MFLILDGNGVLDIGLKLFSKVMLPFLGSGVTLARGGGAGGAEGDLAPPPPTLLRVGGGLSPTTFSEASGEKNSSLWRPWTPASVQSFNGRVSPPTFFFVPPPLTLAILQMLLLTCFSS